MSNLVVSDCPGGASWEPHEGRGHTQEGTALAETSSAYGRYQEVNDLGRDLLTYRRLQAFDVAGFPFSTVGCGGPAGD